MPIGHHAHIAFATFKPFCIQKEHCPDTLDGDDEDLDKDSNHVEGKVVEIELYFQAISTKW